MIHHTVIFPITTSSYPIIFIWSCSRRRIILSNCLLPHLPVRYSLPTWMFHFDIPLSGCCMQCRQWANRIFCWGHSSVSAIIHLPACARYPPPPLQMVPPSNCFWLSVICYWQIRDISDDAIIVRVRILPKILVTCCHFWLLTAVD